MFRHYLTVAGHDLKLLHVVDLKTKVVRAIPILLIPVGAKARTPTSREAEDFTQKADGTAGRKSPPLLCRRSTTRCNSRNPNCGFWKYSSLN